MFKINCLFEKETGTDAMNPLGDIEFTDGRSTVAVRTTYIDSWLDALIKSVYRIRQGENPEVAIPEEPVILYMKLDESGGVTVREGNYAVRAKDSLAFEEALRVACGSFLEGVTEQEEAAHNPAIREIKAFWAMPAERSG